MLAIKILKSCINYITDNTIEVIVEISSMDYFIDRAYMSTNK